jgi:hypothetical protein
MQDQTNAPLTQNSPNQTNVTPPVAHLPAAVTLDGVEDGYGDFLLKRWWQVMILFLSLLIVAVLIVKMSDNDLNVLLLIFPLIMGMVYFKLTYVHDMFRGFANTNHFTYKKYGRPGCSQAGVVFAIGNNKNYSDVVSGMYQSWPFALFMYSYDTGHGRNKTGHDRAIMAVDFGISLPMFVLRRSKLTQMMDQDSTAINNDGYTEKINLEGNFNEHFSVYIRPNSEVEVLSILTPDVMEMLVGLDKYEVEMAENGNFYIYTPNYITKKQSLIDIYNVVEAITPKIGRYADRQRIIR